MSDESVDVSDEPSKWDEIGCSSLKKALKDTVMIDAGWLADLAEKGGIVPRCQDVPDEAKVSLAEMEAWGKDTYTVGALIMSFNVFMTAKGKTRKGEEDHAHAPMNESKPYFPTQTAPAE